MRKTLALTLVALLAAGITSKSGPARAQDPTRADCARACAAGNADVGEFSNAGKAARCVCKCRLGWKAPPGGGACQRVDAERAPSADNCARVAHLLGLYAAKLDQLRRWRGDLARYRDESETARAQAWKGSLSDILGAIPGEATGNFLLKHFPTKVPASFPKRFETALEAARGLNGLNDARGAGTDGERIKNVVEGHATVRELLLKIPSGGETEQARKLLERSGAVFKATGAVLVKAAEGKPGYDWNAIGELAGDVIGSFAKPVATAQSLAHLSIRAGDYGLAMWSARQLTAVSAANWDAERHLQDHIAHWKDYARACPGA